MLRNSGRSTTLFIVTLIRHLWLQGSGQTAGAHLTGIRLLMHKQANFKSLACEGLTCERLLGFVRNSKCGFAPNYWA